MKCAPINHITVNEPNVINAPSGVYVHAREVAAWLRENDLEEPAEILESYAATEGM